MNKQQAEIFINDLFDKLWIPSDLDKISDFYHPDVKAHVGNMTLDYQGLYERIAYNKENLESYQVDITDFIYADNKVSARMNQQAYDKKKGGLLSFRVIVIYHLFDGKIKELWAELTGNLDLKQQ